MSKTKGMIRKEKEELRERFRMLYRYGGTLPDVDARLAEIEDMIRELDGQDVLADIDAKNARVAKRKPSPRRVTSAIHGEGEPDWDYALSIEGEPNER